jgi:hypothetical protein
MKLGRIIFDRIREPSTWAGLGILTTIAGINPALLQSVQGVIGALLGLAAVVLPEKASKYGVDPADPLNSR